jgi:hypothetical protein
MGNRIVAPGSESSVPQYAHHVGRITLTHEDTTPDERLGGQNGATTWWKDGTISYVLHFRSGQPWGWAMADEADTAIQALDSLREGEFMSGDRLWAALRDVRRLRSRLEALESELILYAREDASEGRARMSLREIGEVTQTHHTTVAERIDRMRAGTHPEFRGWLTQNTPREAMYGGTATKSPKLPTLREQIAEAPGGAFLATVAPTESGGYVITVTQHTPEPEELARIELPDWDDFRPASAGHRLIEQGFQVLPAAHYEPDRAAGWKPGADGQTYTAPVYRLPEFGTGK